MLNKRISFMATAFVVCVVSVFGVTYAFLTATDKVTNAFSGGVDIKTEEEVGKVKDFEWKKDVSISNNSQSPALIRVAIVPRWMQKVGEIEQPWAGDVSSKTVSITLGDSKAWIDGGDGYFYYTEIVQKGEKTDSVIANVKANIKDSDVELYKDKILMVDVKSEAVQASLEAYKKAWDTVPASIAEILDKLCIDYKTN